MRVSLVTCPRRPLVGLWQCRVCFGFDGPAVMMLLSACDPTRAAEQCAWCTLIRGHTHTHASVSCDSKSRTYSQDTWMPSPSCCSTVSLSEETRRPRLVRRESRPLSADGRALRIFARTPTCYAWQLLQRKEKEMTCANVSGVQLHWRFARTV